MPEVDADDIRRFAQRREDRRRAERTALHARAERDARAIIDMIIERYAPRRILQWGSVIESEKFREYSDIDIAVEGITDPQAFFDVLADAEDLTRFPVDIVELEHIEAEYRQLLFKKGRVVYEQ